MHIVELQRKLQENRNEINSNTSTNSSRTSSTRYIPRTAAVQKEIIGLLNEGYNAMEVSYILGIPSSQVARIEENNQERREFLAAAMLFMHINV